MSPAPNISTTTSTQINNNNIGVQWLKKDKEVIRNNSFSDIP
jgi:hypothetical protein